MGLLSWIGIGKEIAEPIKAVSDLYTTEKARLETESELVKAIAPMAVEQVKTNQILASSKSFYNSGWQSLIGWTAGFLILSFYAPQIIIITYVWSKYCLTTGHIVAFPMKSEDILNLVYLMFGFGVHSLLR
jgi:hypothetical protein